MIDSTVLLAFLVKHFVVDFPMQGPYQYRNKGNLNHPGGYIHAANHGLVTIGILIFYTLSPWLSIALGLLDAFCHFWIDWSKVNINKFFGLGPTTSEKFWWLVGFDQLLHYLTYWIILRLI